MVKKFEKWGHMEMYGELLRYEKAVCATIPNFISSSISLKILYLSRFFGTLVFPYTPFIHLFYTFLRLFHTKEVGELSSNKDTAFNIESFVTCT